MNIPQRQIEALTAFGYTVSEARFLYMVAMHSGYFTARQFLALSMPSVAIELIRWRRNSSPRGTPRCANTDATGASIICTPASSMPSLATKTPEPPPASAGSDPDPTSRSRFILANQGYQYLETEAEKVAYFCDQLHIEKPAFR